MAFKTNLGLDRQARDLLNLPNKLFKSDSQRLAFLLCVAFCV